MDNTKSVSYESNFLKLNNVSKIISNNPTSLCVMQGDYLCISGENIVLTSFNIDTGLLCATGNILKMEYKKDISPKTLLKKIFK